MFAAILVQVTPTIETTAPAHTGEALRAWFLNLVRAHDPRLSKALHEGDGPRPYTVSDAIGLGPIREGQRQLSPERSGIVRITALTPDLSALLMERIAPMLPGAFVDLSRASLRVEGVSTTPDAEPWAGQATAESLVAEQSLDIHMPRHLTIRFRSPTTFKSQGVHVPFPLPELVFGSLLGRWNTFAPVRLHPDAKRFAEVRVVASRYDLHTRHITFSYGTPEKKGGAVGCVGTCGYTIRSRDKYWVGVIRTLAAFAFFAGVGARTTIGMGQSALWDRTERRPVLVGGA